MEQEIIDTAVANFNNAEMLKIILKHINVNKWISFKQVSDNYTKYKIPETVEIIVKIIFNEDMIITNKIANIIAGYFVSIEPLCKLLPSLNFDNKASYLLLRGILKEISCQGFKYEYFKDAVFKIPNIFTYALDEIRQRDEQMAELFAEYVVERPIYKKQYISAVLSWRQPCKWINTTFIVLSILNKHQINNYLRNNEEFLFRLHRLLACYNKQSKSTCYLTCLNFIEILLSIVCCAYKEQNNYIYKNILENIKNIICSNIKHLGVKNILLLYL